VYAYVFLEVTWTDFECTHAYARVRICVCVCLCVSAGYLSPPILTEGGFNYSVFVVFCISLAFCASIIGVFFSDQLYYYSLLYIYIFLFCCIAVHMQRNRGKGIVCKCNFYSLSSSLTLYYLALKGQG
jgi:hypothetical protein